MKNKNLIEVCILSAGMGTRMKSDLPKALHKIANKPMLAHLLETASLLQPGQIHVVIGQGADLIKQTFSNWPVNWISQKEQLGTGHAVMQAMNEFKPESRVLLLVGDAPLLTLDSMQKLLSAECDLGVLTVDQENPFNYGRINRSGNQLKSIVEEKDATVLQLEIKEVNSGVMVAKAKSLVSWLSKLDTNNSQSEYLLTDIVEIANRESARVRAIKIEDSGEVLGVNNLTQLAGLERYYQKRQAEILMDLGVHIIDPARFDLRGELSAGSACRIDINCIFEGKVELGNDVLIGANCIIKDSVIGEGSVILPNTLIDGAVVAADCRVGPFARLRPGTELSDQVAIGNFVETKKAKLGKGSKSGHLSYLGDTTIGSDVNIGAGTITCNYDGVNKHQTHIGDDVFVGSHTAFVAPVTVGNGSTTAAGSTITKNIENDSLGIARGKQRNLFGWKRPRKK
ncbi:MAG: bifunctional UDP-N-acetylglucosamine diphosphorylase/glucosamine-1-phosphate N-acetyltransferase GlmU [Pseudomonadales bacterium]|nr:bifunctional UDP-N-acetylglucosamine diphosphorylase/glucosamine-1-phosphate N-acetyltransferase GlmU [Pseudomonadales bacterium]